MAVEAIISGLLLYGSWTDLKYRKVENKITFLILLLSLPAIFFNIPGITIIHILALALLIFFYTFFDALGGADLKALVPLTLSFNFMGFLVFYGVILISGGLLSIKYKTKIPFFIPIAAGYASAIMSI